MKLKYHYFTFYVYALYFGEAIFWKKAYKITLKLFIL